MFGYVRPDTGELKVSDLGYYRAAYCGLCRQMGRVCGGSSRLCLSYDMTFLMILRAWLTGEKLPAERAACPANPLLRRKAAAQTEAGSYAAAVSGILAAYSFEDDCRDERFPRRAAAGVARRVSLRWRRRGAARFPGLSEGIGERLARLYAEEEACAGSGREGAADVCASLFGEVLSFICSYGIDDPAMRAVAAAVGKYVGRWDYFTDAADDLHRDARAGRFNPLLSAYGRPDLTDEEKLTVTCLLGAESGAAADALYLSDGSDGDPAAYRVLENILTAGMPAAAREVLAGRYRKPGHASIGEREADLPGAGRPDA